jgi:hypothetical protein
VNKTTWVDTTKWDIKQTNVKAAVSRAIKEMIDWALPDLYKAVVQNVSAPGSPYPLVVGPRGGRYRQRGAQTNAGTLPVPIVWGQLRRSIQWKRFTPLMAAVFSDGNIADYNVHVHYGAPQKKMKARPFVDDASKQRKPAYTNRFKYEIQFAARKYGLT